MGAPAAIAGLGITDMGRVFGRTVSDFAGEAIALALEDAGLEARDLDGLLINGNQSTEMAPSLVGATRESCRTYIEYFLKAWAHRKDAFDDVLETFTDNFLKPGNLAGGFAHYRASHEGRIRMMKGEAPQLAPIDVPTCIRWAEHDPLFPYAWTDRLNETFSDLDLARFPGVGHFPHREDPDRATAEIAAFFTRIGYG